MKILFPSLALLLSSLISTAQSTEQSPALETVAEFGRHQPIGVGIAVSKPSGQQRIFVTFPKNPTDYDYGLVEIISQGTGQTQRRPYPNAEWNQWDSLKPRDRFMNVQAVVADQNNSLWVLDPANPIGKPTMPEGVKLVKINLRTNQVERIYRFEDLPRERTALNDVRVDIRRQVAYLSDPKRATIVVLNLKTGRSRSVLENDKSTKADPNFKLTIDGKVVQDEKGQPFSSNVNGLALTDDFNYLYFRPITQTRLFRIATEHLNNPALSPTQLASHVEDMGATGVSHGMISDAKGNIYLTDSPDKAVRYLTPDRTLKTLVRDSRLLWPDTFAVGADGYLYLTAAQIHRMKKYNHGEDKVDYPYRLYRMKLPR